MSLSAYFRRAAYLARACGHGVPIQRILDNAMADHDATPTLSQGDGADARRLLELVRWERMPHWDWWHALRLMCGVAAAKERGLASEAAAAEDRLRSALKIGGPLVEQPKGRVA